MFDTIDLLFWMHCFLYHLSSLFDSGDLLFWMGCFHYRHLSLISGTVDFYTFTFKMTVRNTLADYPRI